MSTDSDFIEEVLEEVQAYFIKRDEINALMHNASVRYSPLTSKVMIALSIKQGKC